ncbi:MAG: hypothetical protein R6W79_04315 [Acidimicrobiia bacterium]|jgi:hypothetical protein
MRRVVIIIGLTAVLAAGCSTGDSGTTPATGLPENPERCEEADPRVLDFLRTGIVVDEVELPWGFAVKSQDFSDVWIVTAAVEIPGDIDYGTWAIRARVWPESYVGAVSVDEIAMRVSNFGEGTDIVVTNAADGVLSAQSCAIARLELAG